MTKEKKQRKVKVNDEDWLIYIHAEMVESALNLDSKRKVDYVS